jgi:deoxyribonuclease V
VKVADLHPWRLSATDAVALQRSLAAKVRLRPLPPLIRTVAAADVAYSRVSHRMYAAVVVVTLPELVVVERRHAVSAARFPYLPGLFAFRELPPLLAAFRRLRTVPDVMLFDGHGLAHPRRFGLACHAGLLFRRPSLGCAKSLLVGQHLEPGPERGDSCPLQHGGEEVGRVVRTRPGVKPVYVSPGHLADSASSAELVLRLTTRFRLPEPLRWAHHSTVALMRRRDAAGRPAARHSYPNLVRRTPRAAEQALR